MSKVIYCGNKPQKPEFNLPDDYTGSIVIEGADYRYRNGRGKKMIKSSFESFDPNDANAVVFLFLAFDQAALKEEYKGKFFMVDMGSLLELPGINECLEIDGELCDFREGTILESSGGAYKFLLPVSVNR